MSHKHLTKVHREIIANLLNKKHTQREMADIIGFSQATISKEIKRNKDYKGRYISETAHNKATDRRKKASSAPKKQTPENLVYIADKLELYWSPEQIAGRMLLESRTDAVSFKTIYNWMEKGQYSQKRKKKKPFAYHGKYLRIKHYGHHSKRKDGAPNYTIPKLPSIDERKDDQSFGHWECDLVCGRNRSAYIVTLVERQTGFLLLGLSLKKSNECVNAAIMEAFEGVNKKHIKSITYDRGKEFYGYKEIEKEFKNKSYFCHPSCPHEKGLNENTNGLLRQFFPRSKDFSTLTKEERDRAMSLINHRPRKKHKYKTTVEVLKGKRLGHLITFT